MDKKGIDNKGIFDGLDKAGTFLVTAAGSAAVASSGVVPFPLIEGVLLGAALSPIFKDRQLRFGMALGAIASLVFKGGSLLLRYYDL